LQRNHETRAILQLLERRSGPFSMGGRLSADRTIESVGV
jgi:hypothetical protein